MFKRMTVRYNNEDRWHDELINFNHVVRVNMSDEFPVLIYNDYSLEVHSKFSIGEMEEIANGKT